MVGETIRNWRNRGHLLNPLENGFRHPKPERPKRKPRTLKEKKQGETKQTI